TTLRRYFHYHTPPTPNMSTLSLHDALPISPIKQALRHNFSDFKQTTATLRGPEGCQWDEKQTHMSLRQYLLEESYELIEAINNKDRKSTRLNSSHVSISYAVFCLKKKK